MKETEKTWIDNYLPGCFTTEEAGVLDWLQKTWLPRANYKRIIRNGDDYLFAPGTLPVLMVCHLDTVHHTKREEILIFHDREEECLWSPHGIGGDDRAGLIAILEILRLKHRPWLLFTTGEEKGGKGARAFCRADLKALKAADGTPNIRYMVEVDRRGSGEAVFYKCSTIKTWTDFVEGWGFEKEHGSYSDISDIMQDTGICGVNLSAGYYCAHQTIEFILYGELRKTILKLSRQFHKLGEKNWMFTPYVYQAPKKIPYKAPAYTPPPKAPVVAPSWEDKWGGRGKWNLDKKEQERKNVKPSYLPENPCNIPEDIVEKYRFVMSPGEIKAGINEGRHHGTNMWLRSLGRPACIVSSCANSLTLNEAQTNGICRDCNLDYDREGPNATWEGCMDSPKLTDLCAWLLEHEDYKLVN